MTSSSSTERSTISTEKSATGIFYGVGVGPGDPELITLKAARLIENADVITYLVNKAGDSQARMIARQVLRGSVASGRVGEQQKELPIYMPMSDDPSVGDEVYNQAAIEIETYLVQGLSVVFLCEGDPLFFGSFAYLLARIQDKFECISVPGISSPHAASSALNLPLTMMKESFSVISGRHDDEMIEQTLARFDSVIIMKAGRARPRLLSLLNKTKRSADASYLEYIGRDNEKIVNDISTLDVDEKGPYFSLFIITRRTDVKSNNKISSSNSSSSVKQASTRRS